MFLANVLLASVLLVGNAPAHATTYMFTDIGAFTGMGNATDINNEGIVIGNSNIGGMPSIAWNRNTSTSLEMNGGVWGINNAGQIVGSSSEFGGVHATLWNGMTPTDLGSSSTKSTANSINDSGTVVGGSSGLYSYDGQATVWDGTSATILNGLGRPFGMANDINNAGQIVGTTYSVTNYIYHFFATTWIDYKPTTLGTLGGASGEAVGINEAGLIVGVSQNSLGAMHATRWTGITPTDLGTLGGTNSVAMDINEYGQIVGQSEISGDSLTHATIWDSGIATDLNNYLDASIKNSGWILRQASGINDNGFIVGYASNILTHEDHAFLLKPISVPEPKIYTLIMLALGILGFTKRCRKQQVGGEVVPGCRSKSLLHGRTPT
jgi:probable HAF family extracellular repeat protein